MKESKGAKFENPSEEEAQLCNYLYLGILKVLREFSNKHPNHVEHMVTVLGKIIASITGMVYNMDIDRARNHIFRLINFELDNIEKEDKT